MASTRSGGHGGKLRNSTRKNDLEKRSGQDDSGRDVIRAYLGMNVYSVVL